MDITERVKSNVRYSHHYVRKHFIHFGYYCEDWGHHFHSSSKEFVVSMDFNPSKDKNYELRVGITILYYISRLALRYRQPCELTCIKIEACESINYELTATFRVF